MTQPPRRRRAARTLPMTAALLMILAAGAGQAQERAPSPQMQAAQAAFEALPEAERKAIQADLIWAGGYAGAPAGSFGPLTFRAINAAKAGRGAADGILTAAERKALAERAEAARRKVGFRVLADSRTGVRIGVPTALLPKTEATPSGGSRWQSADGRVTLDTSAAPVGEGLAPLFERATGDSVPGRKITYKLLRPDFFVVSGETATGKFYRRLAAGPSGLRGFSVGYEKALAASVDPLVIAIAGSFEPFPSASPATTPAVAGAAASPAPAPVTPAARFGTGFLVGERLVLTAAAVVADCRGLQAGGRPARLRRSDPVSGLALVEVEASGPAAAGGRRETTLPDGAEAVIVAYGDSEGRRVLLALPGVMTVGAVRAPLQPGQAGSPVFDRQGRLAAVVVVQPAATGLVAGVAPMRPHAVADAAAVNGFLAANGLPAATPGQESDRSTGGIVAGAGPATLALTCSP